MKKIFLILVMAVLALPAVAFGATKNTTRNKTASAVANAEQMNITGTVETFSEVGMRFARLHIGQDKSLMLGAMGNLSDATWDCLEKAEEANQQVTVQGLLKVFDDGSSGMDEKTVLCASAGNYLEQIDYFGITPPPLDANAYTKDEFFRKLLYNKQCGNGRSRFDRKYIDENSDEEACYNRGVAILKDTSQSWSSDDRLDYAFGHFKFSAEKDFVPAQYAVGIILANGYEGKYETDGDSAVEWLQRAADQGHAQAAVALPPLKVEAEKAAKEKTERQRRLEEAKRLRAEREQLAQGGTGTEVRLSQGGRPNKRPERQSANVADVKSMRERLEQIEYEFISGNMEPEEARTELESLYKLAASHGYIDGMRDIGDRVSKIRTDVNIAIHKQILREVQRKQEAISAKREPSYIILYNDFLSEISSLRSSKNINCYGSSGEDEFLRKCSQSERMTQESLEEMYKSTRDAIESICSGARKSMCESNLKGFPEEFKHDFVMYDGGHGITIFEFACSATNSGLYKAFTSGSMLSKEIKLELHSGTIYFRRSRIDTKTMQEVNASFNSPNAINFLWAETFESVNGQKTKIAQPGMEMMLLYGQMGGLPKAPGCPQ